MPVDDAQIDEIDEMPKPRRGQLSFVAVQTICHRAARAGLDAARSHPESALDRFSAHTRGMLPADPCDHTLDGWARLGAVQGATAAWTRTGYRMPIDAPSTQHAALHGAAFAFAAGVVMGVIHG